jgi:hypothetical protein
VSSGLCKLTVNSPLTAGGVGSVAAEWAGATARQSYWIKMSPAPGIAFSIRYFSAKMVDNSLTRANNPCYILSYLSKTTEFA